MGAESLRKANPSAHTRARRSPLAILFVTVFVDLVGFGVMIPLLPLYAERFGAGPVAVTLLVAVYSLMQFLFAPWWGRLSDRVGRRPVLLVGLFGSALSHLLFAVAGALPILFLARILAGFMGANIGVAQAYVADVTGPEERARGMALIGAAFGLGFIFGPAMGGLLAPWGLAAPFWAAAALAFLNGIVALFRLPESLDREARVSPDTGGGFAERMRELAAVFGRSRLGRFYAVLFLITFALSAFQAIFALWADRRWNFTPSEVAYLFTYVGVLIVIVQGALVGRLVRRMGERRLALLGSCVLVAGLVGIPFAPSIAGLALVLALQAFGQGTAIPSLSALISREAGQAEQGRLLGASQSLSALGRVLGPLWGGVAFAKLGISVPYTSGAATVVVALLLLLPTLGNTSWGE